MTSVPRIAIDYTPAYEQGAGIGRLVRDLVTSLALSDYVTDYRLFVSGATREQLPEPPGANFQWRQTAISPKWLARLWYRVRLPLPIETLIGQIDLYHATDFVLPPTYKDTKSIVTVHDLSFVRVPETASPRLKRYLDQVVPHSVHRATHVLADSEATRQDLIELYDLAPEKVTTLLSGVDPRFRPVHSPTREQLNWKYHLPEKPYIFSVGTVQPRKNYSRLIEAIALLRERDYDLALVIAGGHGWLGNPIYETIKATNMTDSVHLIGFADDADLPALYTYAACTAYVSLYEGFGFPILESMACGTPVVTSKVSSLPEVAGDAALMIDPYNIEEIAYAIQRILDNATLKNTLIKAGLVQAKQFTWENAANRLMAVYDQVLNKT